MTWRLRRWLHRDEPLSLPPPIREVTLPTRNDCPTCIARIDEHGRFPVGHCGPDCLGRKARDMARAMRSGA